MPLADATVEIVADYAQFTPKLRAGLRKAAAVAGRDADRAFGRITDAANASADGMAAAYEDAAAETVLSFKTAAGKGAQALAGLGEVDLSFDFADDADRAMRQVVTAVEAGSGRARAALATIGDADLGGLGSSIAAEAGKASDAVASMSSGISAELGGLGSAGRAAGRDLSAGLASGLGGAKTAGRDAGRDVAAGVEEGARGRIRIKGAFDDLDDEAKKAGKEAGHSLADSITTVLAGAGIGAGIGATIAQTLDVGKATDNLRAQLGATPAEAAKYSKLAGDLFARNYGESIGDVTSSMAVLIQQLPELKNASDAQLGDVSKDALNLSRVFGVDVTESARAVASMLKSGVAKNADEAFGILTKGFQSGANKGDDLLDTFGEYSVQFQKLGLSGQDALGLINQLLGAGARNSDVAADGIKEFSLQMNNALTQSSAKGVVTQTALGKAFQTLGFDASAAAEKAGTGAFQLQKDIQKGGPAAKAAFGQILDAYRSIEDPSQKAQVGLALFGTKFEDLGASLNAANLGTAAQQVGSIADATKGLDQQGSAASMDSLLRSLQTLGTSVGQTVLPSLNALVAKLSVFTKFLEDHKDVAGPIATGLLGIASASAGIKAVQFGVNATGLPGAVKGVNSLQKGIRGLEGAEGVMGRIGGGLRSIGSAGASAGRATPGALSRIGSAAKTAGSSLGSAAGAAADYGKKIGSAAGSAAKIGASTAKIVAQKAALLGARVATVAFTAAQWLLNAAMAANPIGLIVIAIIAVIAIIVICYKRFSSFREIVNKAGEAIGKFAQWIWDGLKKAFAFVLKFYANMLRFWTSLPGKILGWLGDIGGKLGGFLKKAWDKAYETVTGFYKTMFTFWSGLLGKILSWLGDVGGRLYAYLRDALIRGFVAIGEFELKMLKFFTGLIGKVLGWLGDFGAKISGLFRRAMSAVANAVTTGWAATATFFSGLGSKILGLLSAVGNAIASPFRNAWSSAKRFVSDGIAGVLGVITGLPGRIAGVGSKLFDAGRNLIGKFVSGLSNLGSSAVNFGSKVVGYLKGKLNGGIDTVNSYVDKANGLLPGNPIPHLPHLARGAILRKATLAVVAEAGPEVVIPLTRPARAEELARQSGLVHLLQLRGVLGAPPAAAGPERPAAPPRIAVSGTAPVAQHIDRSVHIGELHVHHGGRDTEHATRKAIARAARAAMAGL